MTPKRIGLFLSVQPFQGGMFQYCDSVLAALDLLNPKKYQVTIICTVDDWRSYLDQSGLEIRYLKHSQNWLSLYKFMNSLGLHSFTKYVICKFDSCIQQINKMEFDTVIFPAQDIVAPLINGPFIGTVHDLMHRYESQFPESASYLRYKARETYFKKVCESATGILVDSVTGKKHIQESYNTAPEKIFVLPYIAPNYIFMDSEEDGKQAFIKKHKLPEKYIFYPAQLWKHKNHDNLIRAVSLLKSELPDIKLVLSGSQKNNYANISALISELDMVDQVYFIGYVNDEEIVYLYQSALALVMPTYYGPTNIPPLEAFALGCPVAVSDIYGMPEQVGDAALLFNPDSPEDIAANIKKLWTDKDLRTDLISKGFLRYKSWNQMHFNALFENILSKLFNES